MIHHILDRTARLMPDHPAIVLHGRETTYGELHRQAQNASRYFVNAGLRKGDRVLMLLDNGPEYAAVNFGLLGAGAVVVPLNPTNTADTVGYIAGHCRARFASGNERAYPHLAEWRQVKPVVDGPARPGTIPLAEVLEGGQ